MSSTLAPDSPWLSLSEAAPYWRVHEKTMQIYARTKKVTAIKKGGRWLIYKPSLLNPTPDVVIVKPRRGRPRKKVA